MTRFWDFLQDENNRAVLSWIGGGIVVIVGWGATIKVRTERQSG